VPDGVNEELYGIELMTLRLDCPVDWIIDASIQSKSSQSDYPFTEALSTKTGLSIFTVMGRYFSIVCDKLADCVSELWNRCAVRWAYLCETEYDCRRNQFNHQVNAKLSRVQGVDK
jgi:hypothetical protein